MTPVYERNSQDRTGSELVPLASVAPAAGAASRPDTAGLNPPRSPFLAQLSRQYESRAEALQRRDAAREDARKSYGRRPVGDQPRHIVWA